MKWISTKERLPEPEQYYFIKDMGGEKVVMWLDKGGEFFTDKYPDRYGNYHKYAPDELIEWLDESEDEQLEALKQRVKSLEGIVELKEKERSDWANMCISKQKIIDSLKEHEEYFNETLACLDCDVKALEKCVEEIRGMATDAKVKELIDETVFHLCKNMK